MAGYIGGKVAVSAPQQIETKHTITATASQTSIPNVGYTVGAVHVYQNGIRLVDGTDYTATNGSTVTLETGATEGDQIVIVSHGSFETSDTVSKASGGTFSAAMNYPGGAVTGDVTHPDSIKAKFGAGDDLQIYHDGSNSYVDDAGTGALILRGNSNVTIGKYRGETMGFFETDGAVSLYHNNAIKLATTATGIDVTGAITVGGAALGSGGLEFIASTDISAGTSTVSFTGFDASKYDSYYFTFHNILPQTDGAYLRIRSSSDTSSHSYDSGSNEYSISGVIHGSGESSSANTQGNLFNAIGTGSGEIGISGTLEVFSAHLSINTFFNSFFGGYNSAGNLINQTMTNIRAEDAQVNAVQFFMNSGNFASGTITMYGMVNS